MNKGIKIVKIELERYVKLQLKSDIDQRMEECGVSADNFAALDLGIDFPEGWPADKDCEPTMAELVVLAGKLGMQVIVPIVKMRPYRDAVCIPFAKMAKDVIDQKPVYCLDCTFMQKASGPFGVAGDPIRSECHATSLDGSSKCYIINAKSNCKFFEPTLWKRLRDFISTKFKRKV
ncbi:MAG: hypothetical protein FVQ82_12995 [Planctomycetes bacterium]|nr:hypothetical protein [Planctomycetota bacterium]